MPNTIENYKQPFTKYDLFGYVLPGLILILGYFLIEFILGPSSLLRNLNNSFNALCNKDIVHFKFHKPVTDLFSSWMSWFIAFGIIILAAYILGQAIATLSVILYDRFLVKSTIGYPTETLFPYYFKKPYYFKRPSSFPSPEDRGEIKRLFKRNISKALVIIFLFLALFYSRRGYFDSNNNIFNKLTLYMLASVLILRLLFSKMISLDFKKLSLIGFIIIDIGIKKKKNLFIPLWNKLSFKSIFLMFIIPFWLITNTIWLEVRLLSLIFTLSHSIFFSLFQLNPGFSKEFQITCITKIKNLFGLYKIEKGDTNLYGLSFAYLKNSSSPANLENLYSWINIYNFARNISLVFMILYFLAIQIYRDCSSPFILTQNLALQDLEKFELLKTNFFWCRITLLILCITFSLRYYYVFNLCYTKLIYRLMYLANIEENKTKSDPTKKTNEKNDMLLKEIRNIVAVEKAG